MSVRNNYIYEYIYIYIYINMYTFKICVSSPAAKYKQNGISVCTCIQKYNHAGYCVTLYTDELTSALKMPCADQVCGMARRCV